jgi:hypothetical protein
MPSDRLARVPAFVASVIAPPTRWAAPSNRGRSSRAAVFTWPRPAPHPSEPGSGRPSRHLLRQALNRSDGLYRPVDASCDRAQLPHELVDRLREIGPVSHCRSSGHREPILGGRRTRLDRRRSRRAHPAAADG